MFDSAKAKKYEYNGEMLTIKEIAFRKQMSDWTVRFRLRHGIDLDAPLHSGQGRPPVTFEHNGVEMTYEQYAAAEGISVQTAMMRRSRGSLVTARKSRRERSDAYNEEALIDNDTPFSRDDRCWYITKVHPDGITLDEVGQLMCLTRERIRQIEAKALRKLRALGIRHEDLVRMRHCGEQLGEIRERRESRFNPQQSGVYYVVQPTALPSGRRSKGE